MNFRTFIMMQKFFELFGRDAPSSRLESSEKLAQSFKSGADLTDELTVGRYRVKIDCKIAEGGYADIYRVFDCAAFVGKGQKSYLPPIFTRGPSFVPHFTQTYALKRMFIPGSVAPQVLVEADRSDLTTRLQQVRDAEVRRRERAAAQSMSDHVKHAFEQEVNVLSCFRKHDNIVHLLDYQIKPMHSNAGYEVFLLLEYCPHGTLFDVIENSCKLGLPGITNETELIKIVHDVAKGLMTLHAANIAHRDIKIENVMLGHDGYWKICDLGSATLVQHNQSLSTAQRQLIAEELEKVATPIYRAPEQLDMYKDRVINQKVDVWALGCIMFTLMYHRPPFVESEKLAQMSGDYRIPAVPKYSQFCMKLLRGMLAAEPEKRLSSKQVLDATENLSDIYLAQNYIEEESSPIRFKKSIHDTSPKAQQHTNTNQMGALPGDKDDSQMYRSTSSKASNGTTSLLNNLLDLGSQGSARQDGDPDALMACYSSKQRETGDSMRTRFDALLGRACQAGTIVPEKMLRQTITNLSKEDFLAQPELCAGVLSAINSPSTSNMTQLQTSDEFALKYVLMAARVLTYVPRLADQALRAQKLEKQFKIFETIHQIWKSNLKYNAPGTFTMKILTFLSGYYHQRTKMFGHFSNLIDTGLNLRAIIERNGNSPETNPLKKAFLEAVNDLFTSLTQINTRILKQNGTSQFALHLQLSVLVMEEQYLLLANLSHLFTAFQIQFHMASHKLSESVAANFQDFMTAFRVSLNFNIQSFIEYVSILRRVDELQHLQHKLPNVPMDLCFVFERVVEKYLQQVKKFMTRQNNSKTLADLADVNLVLNLQFSLQGKIRLPIPFKLYENFEKQCHDKYDFVLAWCAFREKLGQKYQADDLRAKKQESTFEGYAAVAQLQQASMLTNFQRKFMSVSHGQKQQTSGIVGQIRANQKSDVNIGTLAMAHGSQQSSDITVKMNEGGHSRMMSGLDDLRIENIRTVDDDFSDASSMKDMYKSIDKRAFASLNSQRRNAQVASKDKIVDPYSRSETTIELRNSEVKFLKQRLGQIATAEESKTGEQQKPKYVGSLDAIFESDDVASLRSPAAKPAAQSQPADNDFLFQWDKAYGNKTQQMVPSQPVKQEPKRQASPAQQIEGDAQSSLEEFKQVETVSRNPGQSIVSRNQFQSAAMPVSGTTTPLRTEIDAQQFGSTTSDYLLILNERNKSVVRKRQGLKKGGVSAAFIAKEKLYIELEKKQLEQQREAMELLKQETQRKELEILNQQESTQESEKRLAAMQAQLDAMKVSVQENEQILGTRQQQIEESSKQLASQMAQLEKERQAMEGSQKYQQELLAKERDEIEESKSKLDKIANKLDHQRRKNEQDREQVEYQRADVERQLAELKRAQEEVALERAELRDSLEAVKKQQHDQSRDTENLLDMSLGELEKSQEISHQLGSAQDQFVPDESRPENIAVQFIDWILRLRPSQKIQMTELKNPKKIGEGAAAFVYKASFKYTDVAVKQLKVESLIKDGQLSKDFQREIQALVQMSHLNLVMFMGAATGDRGQPVIVTEFCHGGTLFEVLHEKKRSVPWITFAQRRKMALDIAIGMNFMHNLPTPLMHRDLKSLNILLNTELRTDKDPVLCKITDFGLTRPVENEVDLLANGDPTNIDENTQMTGMAGTFHWMAPEVLDNQPYTLKADVYSFGIVLWEILAREPPFADYSLPKIMYNVINYKERPPLKKIEDGCPEELITIMRACWEQDPAARPNFSDVIEGLSALQIDN